MVANLFAGAGSPKRPGHKRMDSLPQHGFGADTSFSALIEQNPFLFRVYTPKSRGRKTQDPFFLGAKFDDADTDESSFSDVEMNDSDTGSDASGSVKSVSHATYADAIKHLDWTKRSSSPYISTSFSFAWAIWEASRRYQEGVKHDVHIAVIDARALVGRAITALELLRQGTPSERHRDHWKFYRFASEAQDVLVFGCIPSTAVLSSVPLVSILPKLPSYFVPDTLSAKPSLEKLDPSLKVLTPPPSPTPFNVVFKDQQTKPSYKQFCQELSERFLRGPDEHRLQDTSANAVRLAVALLRPWLHRSLPKAEAEEVASTVGELALIIAQWPAQWWARDRQEIEGLVRSMVQVIAEEVKETRRVQSLREVERLESIVADIQRTADDIEKKQAAHTASSTEHHPPPYSSKWTTGPSPPPPPPAEQVYSLPPIASALISGLLFGSFCMLSIISSQRWELANHLT